MHVLKLFQRQLLIWTYNFQLYIHSNFDEYPKFTSLFILCIWTHWRGFCISLQNLSSIPYFRVLLILPKTKMNSSFVKNQKVLKTQLTQLISLINLSTSINRGNYISLCFSNTGFHTPLGSQTKYPISNHEPLRHMLEPFCSACSLSSHQRSLPEKTMTQKASLKRRNCKLNWRFHYPDILR